MNLRRFILKLLVFILPVAASLLYIEHRLAAIPNSYNSKHDNFKEQADSVEVLVLGASEATYGINPSYFSHKGYNLADISQDLYFDSALVCNYLAKMPKLKLVLIEVDYMIFDYSLTSNPIEDWRASYYYKYWGIKSDNWNAFDLNNYSLIWLYSRSVVKDLARKKFDTSFVKNMSPNGWMKYDTTVEKDNGISDEFAKKRIKVITSLMTKGNSQKAHNCAANLVRELAAKNIKVEFINIPVYSTYRKYCNPDTLANNTKFIKELCQKYGCYYTDYFADNRFTLADFHNNDHLNFRGAEKLSRLIDQDIIKPLLN
jgi:hypothetical protein